MMLGTFCAICGHPSSTGPSVHNHLGLFLAVTLQIAVWRGLLKWPEIEIGRQGETDPSRHPETNILVQKALKRRRKQKHLNKDKPLPSNCRLSFLPLDTVWLLFNCLNYYDLWNLINADQFPIPNRYWRRRANLYLDLMDDVNELELDWPFLCLELERLHATLWVIDDIDQLSVKFNDELGKKEEFRLQPKDIIKQLLKPKPRGTQYS
ncbi:hypothetical protein SI65_06640 [Aspergillus cristatus]|uniref:Uncharacterized protein n=1 Tax=Aspergillus cristatus TaxID=573508 RepID=A0A1E3BA60_ASPCR|nr:hypothetical protein SI65_06640 [Aspergillus cristatus]